MRKVLTHKIEISPNKTICKLLEEYFGFSRHIYNRGLEIWNKEYKEDNKPNSRKVRDIIKANKLDWYSSLSPQVIDTSIEDLERAFKMFFSKISRYPKFKSKKVEKKSVRFYRKNDSTIRIKDNKLLLPKFPYPIKMKEKIRFNGIIKTCTITKRANKYFANFSIELNEDNKFKSNNNLDYCGIDLGLKNFVILVDNMNHSYLFNYPSKLKAYYAKRDKLNKYLSRKIKDSNRYFVMRTKLQRTYMRISNIQQDFLHKLTKWIITNYHTITIEDLNVKGMLKLHTLSGKVYNSLFYHFKEILRYKSQLYGNRLIIADRYFASTQICNHCGYRKIGSEKLSLSKRTYICNECGYTNDRDINAALNLRDYGINS